MSKFESVNIVKTANIYFDGKVTSRTVEFADGKPELMEIQSGQLSYCLAGETQWHDVRDGQSFNVPGNSYFELKVTQVADYICSFR